MFFATPELARATLTRIAQLQPANTDPDAPTDPMYRRTDLSLDFYRAIRSHQREHLESKTYSRAVTAFGLGLLNATGSRVSRRQSDLSADRDMSLRQIRAIPHNSILQQLGYPVNIIAGVGSAADGSYEDLAALLQESDRGRQLVRTCPVLQRSGQHQNGRGLWRIVQFRLLGQPPLSRHRGAFVARLPDLGRTSDQG